MFAVILARVELLFGKVAMIYTKLEKHLAKTGTILWSVKLPLAMVETIAARVEKPQAMGRDHCSPHNRQLVQRASHSDRGLVNDVRVNHRRLQAGVSQ